MKMYDKKNELRSFKIISACGVLLLIIAWILGYLTDISTVSAVPVMEEGVAISKEMPELIMREAMSHRVALRADYQKRYEAKILMSTESEEKDEEILPLVFDPSDVRVPSNITKEQLSVFIAYRCPEWVGLEEQILQYDSRINLIFLLAVGRAETSAGEDVVGSYNCFNTKDFYTGEYIDYTSNADSIDAFVNLLETEYLSEDGMWWEGGYSIETICIHYATERWASWVTELGDEIKWILEERVPVWKEELETGAA